MVNPPLKAIIEACDRAISQEDYETLIDYYAEDALLVALEKTGKIRLQPVPQAVVYYMGMNQKNANPAKPEVREARGLTSRI